MPGFRGTGDYVDAGAATPGIFGDGSSGDVTLNAGGTITLGLDQWYNNLTITNNTTLNTYGFRVRVKNVLQIDAGSRLSNYGGNAVGATRGERAGGFGGPSTATLGIGTEGSNGSTGAAGNASGLSDAGGGSGGSGGAGAAGGGGGGGVAVVPGPTRGGFRHAPVSLSGQLQGYGGGPWLGAGCGGGGGGGDGANSGGGGGGCGGVVLVVAHEIILEGTITANGGNGANGVAGNSGGGGGGGGGVVFITYNKKTGAGTITAAGGTKGLLAGAGSANGIDGSAGVVIELTP